MNNNDFIDIHNFKHQYDRSLQLMKDNKNILLQNKKSISSFLDQCSADGITAGRRKKYVYALIQICEWTKKKDLTKLTLNECNKLFSNLESGKIKKKDGGKYTANSLYDYKTALKKFFKFSGITALSASIKAKKPRDKIPPESIWSDRERRDFVEYGNNAKEKAFLAMLSETGCRIGEIGTLQIKNIVPLDSGEYQIFIQRSKTEQRTIVCIWSAPYVKEWLVEHPDRSNPNAPLWTTSNPPYTALCYRILNKYVKEASKKAGITKPCNPHILRHSDTTIKLRSGYNPYLLAKQKGITLKRIEQTYEHLKPEDIFNEERRYNGKSVNNGHDKGLTIQCKQCGSPMSEGLECIACKRIAQEMLLQKERIEQQRTMIQQEMGVVLANFMIKLKDLPNERSAELLEFAKTQNKEGFVKALDK